MTRPGRGAMMLRDRHPAQGILSRALHRGSTSAVESASGDEHVAAAIDVSVIICTRDRARLLADTLESFSRLALENTVRAELIVVDNGSSDETRSVVGAFRERHPGTHYVREPRVGQTHARNAGIRASHGDVIVFTDDDVFFETLWLTALSAVFRDHPEAACAGGRSFPSFDGQRPEWLADSLLPMYACRDFGTARRRLMLPEYPYGLNMAFRREVFQVLGLFNTEIGRKGTNLLSSDESEFFHRVYRAGLVVVYTPDAIVFHRIPPSRLRRAWAIRRWYWQGISDVVMKQALEPASRLALLKDAARAGRRVVRDCTGGFVAPHRIYAHVKSTTFHRRLWWIAQLARMQRSFTEAIRVTAPSAPKSLTR